MRSRPIIVIMPPPATASNSGASSRVERAQDIRQEAPTSVDQVPVKTAHSTMQCHMWVVLIAGSTGSALRAVRPPNLHITPDVRCDLVTPQARRVPRSPLTIIAQAIRARGSHPRPAARAVAMRALHHVGGPGERASSIATRSRIFSMGLPARPAAIAGVSFVRLVSANQLTALCHHYRLGAYRRPAANTRDPGAGACRHEMIDRCRNSETRRALEAARPCSDGCTEEFMLAHDIAPNGCGD